ncbi:hypothetical protein [Streptomyces sp. SYSU K217416]
MAGPVPFTRRNILGYAAAGVAAAAAGTLAVGAAATPATAAAWPRTIPLPDGFRPEGIAIGHAPYSYFGSLGDGSVYRAELWSGRGRIISPGREGSMTIGVKIDRRCRLFASGGYGGDAARDVRLGL